MNGYTRYGYGSSQRRGPHHSVARKLGVDAVIVLIVGAVLSLIIGLVAWGIQYEWGSEHNVTFKIASVTNIATGTNGHEYDVYTSQYRVLMNADSLLHGKSDSANVQAWLQGHVGDTVTCPVYGYRIFLLSSKMDILDGCKVDPAGTPVNY